MRFKMHRLACALAAALAVLAGKAAAEPAPGAAQDAPPVYEKLKQATNKDLYQVNIAVPTATALTVIGAKDAPGVGADIAPDLYFQASPKDKGVPELALSTRPYWLFFNPQKSIEEYQDDRRTSAIERIFARTRVSLATANNSKADGFAMGAGFNTILTGQSDPRSDALFLKCVQSVGLIVTSAGAAGPKVGDDERARAQQIFMREHPVSAQNTRTYSNALSRFSAAPDELSLKAAFGFALQDIAIVDPNESDRLFGLWQAAQPSPGATAQADTVSGAKKAYADCVKKATTRYQATPAWAVGAGAAYRATTLKFDDLKYAGLSVWTTYRIPLFGASREEEDAIATARRTNTDIGQNPEEGVNWKGSLVFSARYISDDKVQIDKALKAAATSIGAIQFTAARGPLEFFATAAYYDQDYKEAALKRDRFERYSVGVNTPIGKGLAVELSGGTTHGSSQHRKDDFFIFRLTATKDALESVGGYTALLGFLQ